MLRRSTIAMAATANLTALIVLCLAWELWLAPLRPGGSMLALKTLPLLLPLFGVLRGKRYTYQWSSMLVLAYFAEGCVRAYAEVGPSRTLALTEVGLSMTYFGLAIQFARATRAPAASPLKPGG